REYFDRFAMTQSSQRIRSPANPGRFKELGKLVDVGLGRIRRREAMHQTFPVGAHMHLISGSRALSLFFLELGGEMIVASTIVPDFARILRSSSSARTSLKTASL
ncbi:hypothetical protein, partial [Gaopeijia maritima]